MSDGKLEKMEKDYSPQVDALLPETDALLKVQLHNPSSFYSSFVRSTNQIIEVFLFKDPS